jgi:hypothetical protein
MVLSKLGAEGDVLARVTVRLLEENELGQFNYYLRESIIWRVATWPASGCGMSRNWTGNGSRS